jgi:hypothetical protein
VVELTAVGDDVDLEANDVDDVELEVDHAMGDDVEVDREPDMFDNERSMWGVDDENIYIPVPPSNAQAPTNAELNDNVSPFDHIVDDVATEGDIHLEEEVNDADPQEIRVLHDPENPNIVKGGLFPDIISFRKAIRHYAVKKGFKFAPGGKSDKTRFM